MKDAKTLRVAIIIAIGGVALIALYLGLVLPREKTRAKRLKAIWTQRNFYRNTYEIRLYERDNGEWPSRIDMAIPSVLPEFLSDPQGSATVHPAFNGTGGWVYDPEGRKFCVNLRGTVGEILGLPERDELTRSVPSEWRWSEREMPPDGTTSSEED